MISLQGLHRTVLLYAVLAMDAKLRSQQGLRSNCRDNADFAFMLVLMLIHLQVHLEIVWRAAGLPVVDDNICQHFHSNIVEGTDAAPQVML